MTYIECFIKVLDVIWDFLVKMCDSSRLMDSCFDIRYYLNIKDLV